MVKDWMFLFQDLEQGKNVSPILFNLALDILANKLMQEL